MSQSLRHTLSAMHLALLLTVGSFLWNGLALLLGGIHDPVSHIALLALISGGTAAVTGDGGRASIAFVLSATLAGISFTVALIPAAVVIAYRIVRRVIMLSQLDKTARRSGPRPGFWRTMQAWVGWQHVPVPRCWAARCGWCACSRASGPGVPSDA